MITMINTIINSWHDFLKVYNWPRKYRRLFLIMLPISGIVWLFLSIALFIVVLSMIATQGLYNLITQVTVSTVRSIFGSTNSVIMGITTFCYKMWSK